MRAGPTTKAAFGEAGLSAVRKMAGPEKFTEPQQATEALTPLTGQCITRLRPPLKPRRRDGFRGRAPSPPPSSQEGSETIGPAIVGKDEGAALFLRLLREANFYIMDTEHRSRCRCRAVIRLSAPLGRTQHFFYFGNCSGQTWVRWLDTPRRSDPPLSGASKFTSSLNIAKLE